MRRDRARLAETIPGDIMLHWSRLWGCVLVAACSGRDAPAPVGAEVVTGWNRLVLELAEGEDHLLTLKGVRTAAMTHLAMHDALQAIAPRYTRYADSGPRVDADPVAAADLAAYTVMLAQYPDQAERLRQERDRWMVGAGGAPLDTAIALGQRAAAAVLRARAGDGWDRKASYTWHPMAPGVYAEFDEHSRTPKGFVFGAGWALVTPFMIGTPDRFRPPPPPDIQGAAYAAAFREVKDVGARHSTTRTADQAHLAMWWKEFVEKSHNRLARELVAREQLDLWDATRLFALLNMSIFDGYIASFDGKYFYTHWRPYTAIRWASHDGNPETTEDPDWTNLHDHTYAFPSYPSAHGTVCGAASMVLADVFGAEHPFTLTIRSVDSQGPLSPPVAMDPASRSFDSFAEAARECALSRVYLGIHFRYDSEEGLALGRKVGGLGVREFLRRQGGAVGP